MTPKTGHRPREDDERRVDWPTSKGRRAGPVCSALSRACSPALSTQGSIPFLPLRIEVGRLWSMSEPLERERADRRHAEPREDLSETRLEVVGEVLEPQLQRIGSDRREK